MFVHRKGIFEFALIFSKCISFNDFLYLLKIKIDLLDKYKISLCFHHELYHYIIIVDDIDVRLLIKVINNCFSIFGYKLKLNPVIKQNSSSPKYILLSPTLKCSLFNHFKILPHLDVYDKETSYRLVTRPFAVIGHPINNQKLSFEIFHA